MCAGRVFFPHSSADDSISDVESQLSDLEDEEAIQKMIANGTIFEELAKFKLRLAELTALNDRLRNNAGTDELANTKASLVEMDRLRDELDKEAADRRRLEAEIMALKSASLARVSDRARSRDLTFGVGRRTRVPGQI